MTADEFKKLRTDTTLSQAAFARFVGVSERTVKRWDANGATGLMDRFGQAWWRLPIAARFEMVKPFMRD